MRQASKPAYGSHLDDASAQPHLGQQLANQGCPPKKKKSRHLKDVVLQDLFISLHTHILIDYVALIALFIVEFGLKWLFGHKRLPTPALEHSIDINLFFSNLFCICCEIIAMVFILAIFGN